MVWSQPADSPSELDTGLAQAYHRAVLNHHCRLSRFWLLGASLLLTGSSPGSAQTTGGLELGWRHEEGVESRAIVTVTAARMLHPRVRLGGGLGLSLFEHTGPAAYGLDARIGLLPFWDLGFEAAVQHEQWNDWRVGENRMLGLVSAQPLGGLELGAGLGWRAPLLDTDGYWSPVDYRSDAPELNLVYRARWRALAMKRGSLTVAISNRAGLRLYTPHHIALQLDGRFGLRPGWVLTGHAGTALKGLSALVFSVGEFELAAGVAHEF